MSKTAAGQSSFCETTNSWEVKLDGNIYGVLAVKEVTNVEDFRKLLCLIPY